MREKVQAAVRFPEHKSPLLTSVNWEEQVHGYEREREENCTAIDNRQPHFGYLFTSLISFELQHCKACPYSGSDVDVLGNSNEVGERERANVLNNILLVLTFLF